MTVSHLYWFIYSISDGKMRICIDGEANWRRNSWLNILKITFYNDVLERCTQN